MKNKNTVLIGVLSIFILSACTNSSRTTNSNESATTGWKYNDAKQGGFNVVKISEQTPGPGLMFVEGGRLTMGRVAQDVMYGWNNISKTVSVSSFYIDETEVRNIDYVEYLHWIKKYYVNDMSGLRLDVDIEIGKKIYENALPDTLVWRDKLGENEIFVNNYLRHPAYREYPVVGVSWEQANDYCIWRTDRVNERILIDAGLIMEVTDEERSGEKPFTTDGYLHGDEDYMANFADVDIHKPKINNLKYEDGEKNKEGRWVKMEDGILLPNYRLPTEAEWEHAALGYIGNDIGENHEERKIYPWNGSGVRNNSTKNQGQIMANFKRGRGDNMGISGNLNDKADITAPVRSYWPNDYGLYNMAGNVSEWVADVYRPITEQTSTADHRSFRGNVYKTPEINPNAKDGENPYIIDDEGHIKTIDIDSEDNIYRRNYKRSDNINYLDGDIESQLGSTTKDINEESDKDKEAITVDKRNLGKDDKNNTINDKDGKFGNSNEMYDYGEASLISDKARVYKGGSWKDRAYWLNPGTRRFLDQTLASDCIGFRCAMDRVGASESNLRQNKRREVDYSKSKK